MVDRKVIYEMAALTGNFQPRDFEEAGDIQEHVRREVRIIPLEGEPVLVAAADAAYSDDSVVAAASLYSYAGLAHVADAFFRGRPSFPYRSGFLAFREGSAIAGALKKLERPDVILIDGQGIAHPRGAGIASHIGVILNKPTIGCAKTRLTGRFDEPGATRGCWTYLYEERTGLQPIGAVLRTRSHVKPLFISPGHLIDIESSVRIVLGCFSGYRIPEPLRRADKLSKTLSRDA
ncbi:MAG: endonuclease V [Candidatus Sulfobium sp.]